MERGRTFFITLALGLISLILFLTGVIVPSQVSFESRPYARAVLLSGHLDRWTAAELGLEKSKFELVKAHYQEFLRRNRAEGESESSDDDSDEEDDDLEKTEYNVHQGYRPYDMEHEDDDRRKRDDDSEDDDQDDDDNVGEAIVPNHDDSSSDSSSDSSDDDDDEEESSDDETEAVKLESKPYRQTVDLGLFRGRICQLMKGSGMERCYTVSTAEGIQLMNHESTYMGNAINMPMWNNLRVESLFSIFACCIGLVCLFASLNPCCDNKRVPVYLGSLAFSASGVLAFVPIVRLLLVRSDFEQSLVHDFNVTTNLKTSWSLLPFGLGIPFSILAAFTIIATKWYKKTKHLYTVLKMKMQEHRSSRHSPSEGIGMSTVNGRQKLSDDDATHYENIEKDEHKTFIPE